MNQDQVVFAGSLLVLAILTVMWLLKKAKQRRARNWPSAAAAVESSSVTLVSGGGQPGAAAYYAELRYSYEVQGQRYQGRLRRRFILKGRADKWTAECAGKPLTVRYNGENPGDSVVLESDRTAPPSLPSPPPADPA